jgi:nucleotide-binding universal stress UspA family protein
VKLLVLERGNVTMYDVLVPVDDSIDRALDQARRVTSLPLADDVHATVFHVFTGANVEGASVAQHAPARRAREHLEDHGVEVTFGESSGDVTEEVLERAREEDVDLVTLAGRRRSPAGKLLMGSVSQEVLLRSQRPVLFCPHEMDEE